LSPDPYPLPFLDSARLADLAVRHADAYQAAKPFPHVVLDDFLPASSVDQLISEFPGPEEIDWQRFENPREKKLASKSFEDLGPFTRMQLAELNGASFLVFLERLTGIGGLMPDPYFWGGGLHQLPVGGMLEVHADFNWHDHLRLHRRLNVLIYLNPDWPDSYGGHLELWSRDMSRCEQRVLPIANRCVIFTTTDQSYHGNPEPVTCPQDRTRKSIALYYYTREQPPGAEPIEHSTLFQRRPAPDAQG